MNIRTPVSSFFLFGLTGLLSACHFWPWTVQNGKGAWELVLESCVGGDLQKSKPLYFGAANSNGVGSIWSLDNSTGDYWPTSQLADLGADADFVRDNKPFKCSGTASEGVSVDLGIGAKPVVFPLSGEISTQLSRAKSAIVKVDYVIQEDAQWDRFNAVFQSLPPGGAIMKGVTRGNRYVVARAWKAKGFTAVLKYDNGTAAAAKLALDKKVVSGSLNVSTKLTDSSTLEISTPEEVYIAGVLRKLSPKDGLSAGDGQVVREEVPAQDNAQFTPPM